MRHDPFPMVGPSAQRIQAECPPLFCMLAAMSFPMGCAAQDADTLLLVRASDVINSFHSMLMETGIANNDPLQQRPRFFSDSGTIFPFLDVFQDVFFQSVADSISAEIERRATQHIMSSVTRTRVLSGRHRRKTDGNQKTDRRPWLGVGEARGRSAGEGRQRAEWHSPKNVFSSP